MQLADIRKGPKGRVACLVDGRGDCDFHVALQDLEDAENPVTNKVKWCIEEWCERGRAGVVHHLRRVLRGTHPQISEWRLGKYRVFWHSDGDLLLISEIAVKCSAKAKLEIKRAETLAWNYLRDKKAGEITYVKLSEVDDGQE
jgi:hypothetical protein